MRKMMVRRAWLCFEGARVGPVGSKRWFVGFYRRAQGPLGYVRCPSWEKERGCASVESMAQLSEEPGTRFVNSNTDCLLL